MSVFDWVVLPSLLGLALVGFWLGLVRVLSFIFPVFTALVVSFLFRKQISPFVDVVFGSMVSAQDASLGGYALFVFMVLSVAIAYGVFWFTKHLVRIFAMTYPTLSMRVAGGSLSFFIGQMVVWYAASFGLINSLDSWWVQATQPFAPRWVLSPAQQLKAVVPLEQLPSAFDATQKLLGTLDIQEAVSNIKVEDIKEISLRIKNLNSDANAAAVDMTGRENQKLDQIKQITTP